MGSRQLRHKAEQINRCGNPLILLYSTVEDRTRPSTGHFVLADATRVRFSPHYPLCLLSIQSTFQTLPNCLLAKPR